MLNEQIAANSRDKWHQAHLDETLHVAPENKGAEKLEQVEGHAFNAVYFFGAERLIAWIAFSFVVFFIVFVVVLVSLQRL